MSVRVEFFGIPRRRAGVETADIAATTMQELLSALGERFPAFRTDCLDGDRLRPAFLASINGRTFTRDPARPLHAGDTVQVLSADVGG